MPSRAVAQSAAATAASAPSNSTQCRRRRSPVRRASGSSSSTTAPQRGDLAEVGDGGLEAVEADDQRGVIAPRRDRPRRRGVRGRTPPRRTADGVASTASRASASASAARSPERRDPQAGARRRDALGHGSARADHRIPAQLAQREHLQSTVPRLAGGRQRGAVVVEGVDVALQGLPPPARGRWAPARPAPARRRAAPRRVRPSRATASAAERAAASARRPAAMPAPPAARRSTAAA